MIWIIVGMVALGFAYVAIGYLYAKAEARAAKEAWRRKKLARSLEKAQKIADHMSEPLPDDDRLREWVRESYKR